MENLLSLTLGFTKKEQQANNLRQVKAFTVCYDYSASRKPHFKLK